MTNKWGGKEFFSNAVYTFSKFLIRNIIECDLFNGLRKCFIEDELFCTSALTTRTNELMRYQESVTIVECLTVNGFLMEEEAHRKSF